MSAARTEVLARIRAALADRPVAPPPAPEAAPAAAAEAPAGALFAERVADYRAEVTEAAEDEIGAAVATILDRHAARRVAVPAGFPAAWLPPGLEILDVTTGDRAAIEALRGVDGVLTTAAGGIAETGTIVLDGGPGQGPRAATLVPDLHVCVVRARTVVRSVPEAVARIHAGLTAARRPVTLISGPSATSDIELERVEGVHGPRRLEVVLVAEG